MIDNDYPMRSLHPAVRFFAFKQSKVEGIRFELPFVDLFASCESVVNTVGLLFHSRSRLRGNTQNSVPDLSTMQVLLQLPCFALLK